MRNNCCSFERLFKIQKNGFFFFLDYLFFHFRDIDVFVLCKLGKR